MIGRPILPAPPGALLLGALLALALILVPGARAGAAPSSTAGAAPASVPDLTDRLRACTGCHGPEGRASRDGYLPRLAGKPAGYLADQLIAFREGRRQHAAMHRLLAPLSDDYLREIGAHFAAIDRPYPAPLAGSASAAELARGEALARHGDTARGIPACAACHGPSLLGAQPGVPGLLGLPRDYLNAQLGAWKAGQRRAADPDCMADIARRLRPEDIAAVSSWLASRPVAPGARPLPAPLPDAPMRCGSFQRRATEARTTTPTRELAAPWRDAALPGRAGPPPSRGEVLARAGNCVACHTAPGGSPLAGGRPIETPFGVVYSSNLTPDPATGLGAWSAADFRRAMHEGRSRDDRLLSPAFPYTSFTRLAPADVDEIFGWLRSLPPVTQPQPSPRMSWPFGTQWALTLWRWMYFEPATAAEIARAGTDRGSYLVEVLGHCEACHAPRNPLGAVREGRALTGGPVGAGRWHAPSLADPAQAGVQDWPIASIVALLRDGHDGPGGRGAVLGPMAEVVRQGTAHLSETDLHAMAARLKAQPRPSAGGAAAGVPRSGGATAAGTAAGTAVAGSGPGAALYREHCADCHGDDGRGRAGVWPALAGNRAIAMPRPDNLIAVVLDGGFAPSTAGNPRPYGMPPFGHLLDDTQVAALISHLRATWGSGAGPVSPQQVQRARR